MRTTFVRSLEATVFLGLVAAVACTGNGAVTLMDKGMGLGATGLPSGASCDAQHACRTGLACTTAGKCAPCGCTAAGAPCTISDECSMGQYCGPQRTCTGIGVDAGAANASCTSDAECGSGLRCDLVGLSAQCEPEGKTDVGGKCMVPGDCLAGLVCTMSACTALPPAGDGGIAPLAIPPVWAGETCKDDPGGPTAYFHVPRGSNDGDFYRLPST